MGAVADILKKNPKPAPKKGYWANLGEAALDLGAESARTVRDTVLDQPATIARKGGELLEGVLPEIVGKPIHSALTSKYNPMNWAKTIREAVYGPEKPAEIVERGVHNVMTGVMTPINAAINGAMEASRESGKQTPVASQIGAGLGGFFRGALDTVADTARSIGAFDPAKSQQHAGEASKWMEDVARVNADNMFAIYKAVYKGMGAEVHESILREHADMFGRDSAKAVALVVGMGLHGATGGAKSLLPARRAAFSQHLKSALSKAYDPIRNLSKSLEKNIDTDALLNRLVEQMAPKLEDMSNADLFRVTEATVKKAVDDVVGGRRGEIAKELLNKEEAAHTEGMKEKLGEELAADKQPPVILPVETAPRAPISTKQAGVTPQTVLPSTGLAAARTKAASALTEADLLALHSEAKRTNTPADMDLYSRRVAEFLAEKEKPTGAAPKPEPGFDVARQLDAAHNEVDLVWKDNYFLREQKHQLVNERATALKEGRISVEEFNQELEQIMERPVETEGAPGAPGGRWKVTEVKDREATARAKTKTFASRPDPKLAELELEQSLAGVEQEGKPGVPGPRRRVTFEEGAPATEPVKVKTATLPISEPQLPKFTKAKTPITIDEIKATANVADETGSMAERLLSMIDALEPAARQALIDKIPMGSKPLGEGAFTVALLTPEGKVITVRIGTQRRPAVMELLQPSKFERFGERILDPNPKNPKDFRPVTLEELDRVQTLDEIKATNPELFESLQGKLKEFVKEAESKGVVDITEPWGRGLPRTDNIALLPSGELILIDPGMIESGTRASKLAATKPAPGLLAEPPRAAVPSKVTTPFTTAEPVTTKGAQPQTFMAGKRLLLPAEQVLRAARRKGPKGTWMEDQPEPLAARILRNKDLSKILAEIPDGSKVIGAGKDTLALETPNGEVIRIGPDNDIPNIPEVQQPTKTVKVGGFRIDTVEKLDIKGITDADVAAMEARLKQRGLSWGDPEKDNMGRAGDGRLLVLDHDSVRPDEARLQAREAGAEGGPIYGQKELGEFLAERKASKEAMQTEMAGARPEPAPLRAKQTPEELDALIRQKLALKGTGLEGGRAEPPPLRDDMVSPEEVSARELTPGKPPTPPRPPRAPAPGAPEPPEPPSGDFNPPGWSDSKITEPRLKVVRTGEIRDAALAKLDELATASADEPTVRLYKVIRRMLEDGVLEPNWRVLAEENMTLAEFVQHWSDTYHKAGQQLQQLSVVKKELLKLAADNPILADLLDNLQKKYNREITAWERTNKVVKGVANFWRAALISPLRVALKAAITQSGVSVVVNNMDAIFEHALRAAFPQQLGAAKISLPDELQVRLLEMLPDLVKNASSRDKTTKFLDALAKYNNGKRVPSDIERALFGEIAGEGSLSGGIKTAMTFFMSVVEKGFRRYEFEASVQKRLVQAGLAKDLFKADPKAVPHDIAMAAVQDALTSTFALNAPPGTFMADYIGVFKKMPLLYFVQPFPRMMYNSIKMLADHSPLAAVRAFNVSSKDLFGRLDRASQKALVERTGSPEAAIELLGKDKKAELLAKAMTGTTLLFAATIFANSKYSGDRWNEIVNADGDGRSYDTKPFAPLSSYLAFGKIFKAFLEAKGDTNSEYWKSFQANFNMTPFELAQLALSINRLGGTAHAFLEFPHAVSTGTISADESWNIIKNIAAELASGFTMPFENVKMLFQAMGQDPTNLTLYENRADVPAKMGQHFTWIPGVAESMTPKYNIFTGEPMTMEDPVGGSVLGVSGRTKTALQREMDQKGFDVYPYRPRTGYPDIDNVLASYMGKLLKPRGEELVSSPGYQGLQNKAAQRFVIKNLFNSARKFAEGKLEQEHPELAQRLGIKRIDKDVREMYGIEAK